MKEIEDKKQDSASELPDEEVLKLSLKDPSHFSILVDKYQAAFLRKVMGVVRSREEAEDIVQEAFVKIYKYGHKFEKKPGIAFKSWAYKILMNTSFTHYQDLKKKFGKEEYLDPLVHHEMPSGEDGRDLADISDAKAAVALVIDKMPEHLAKVLRLYYLEDKSYKDICEIEDITTATLKMRLFRAKKLFYKISTEA
ncbi:MAG: RNA polymerase sigma factor [bacterium]|nr:RNA polymerase sigma factor [bacterium]